MYSFNVHRKNEFTTDIMEHDLMNRVAFQRGWVSFSETHSNLASYVIEQQGQLN